MVDQPGKGEKDTSQGTIFNSDIGDDWGEAFEAEDFMAAPKEEASTEFFLPDEPTAGTLPPSLAGDAAQIQPQAVSSPGGRIPLLLVTLRDRFRRTPLPLRLALLLIPLVGLTLFLTLPRLHPPPAPEPGAQPKTEAVQPAAETPALPPPPEAPTDGHATTPPVAVHEESPPPPPPEPKKLRKKWRFPALIVRAKAETDQPPIILATDLTLVLKLAPESIPPAGREPFVRELLYQFYTNQPPADLRRYALERGEMNRRLQAWIMKQWPELPLDAITIDRYQLL